MGDSWTVRELHVYEDSECEGDPIQVTSVFSKPSKPDRSDIVDGDTLEIDIELHGIKLTSVNFDLCKIAGGSCPYAAGTAINPKATCKPLPPFRSFSPRRPLLSLCVAQVLIWS